MKTVSQEGMSGLFRGLLPNVLQVFPASAIQFGSYTSFICVHNRLVDKYYKLMPIVDILYFKPTFQQIVLPAYNLILDLMPMWEMSVYIPPSEYYKVLVESQLFS